MPFWIRADYIVPQLHDHSSAGSNTIGLRDKHEALQSQLHINHPSCTHSAHAPYWYRNARNPFPQPVRNNILTLHGIPYLSAGLNPTSPHLAFVSAHGPGQLAGQNSATFYGAIPILAFASAGCFCTNGLDTDVKQRPRGWLVLHKSGPAMRKVCRARTFKFAD